MTVFADTARRRPASHAFVVPVVRELAPQPSLAAGSAW
jgi:hypothetical protein